MKDDFGDRMKMHEAVYTEARVNQPYVYARIDGRGFSKFTKNMTRPYDWNMSEAMRSVTKTLVDKTHALVGYTQSDEISLAWERDKIMFDSKIQKITSVLAGMASSAFTMEMIDRRRPGGFDPPLSRIPHFDARVFGLPDENELANAFLWRVKDARRNAISGIAQSMFSHKELQHKSTKQMKAMIEADSGCLISDLYPNAFLYGSFFRRELRTVELTEQELVEIPEKFRPEGNRALRTDVVVSGSPHLDFIDIKEFIFD